MEQDDCHKEQAAKKRWLALFWRRNSRSVIFWSILALMLAIGWAFHLDNHILAAMAILWGLGTQIFVAAFALLVSTLGTVPVLGPLVVKVITLPVVLTINGMAFIASLVGVKIGHKRRVFESRVAATILVFGILIGYILGKVF